MDTGHVPPQDSVEWTVGIDLASQPAETGVCVISWTSGGGAQVVELEKAELSDDALVELMLDRRVAKVAIDAPFGWPLPFIDAIETYRDTGQWLDLEPNSLRFRATELRIYDEFHQWPLSVAMDNLAWPAMRCARLLSRVVASAEFRERRDPRGAPPVLDRSGQGLVAEVYPMAALRRWELVAAGASSSTWSYKGDKPGRRERREQHLQSLLAQLDGRLEMSDDLRDRCAADDDDFDAFVSALVARAVQRGQTDPIPRHQSWLAMREGWIHLPLAGSLGQLWA